MARTCTVCRLPAESRQKVNQALLTGESLRDIARRFATSKDALHRHQAAHVDGLRQKVVKVEEARELASAESLVDKLERYERDALRLAEKAEAAGDLRTAASILTTGVTRFAELVARLRGELQQQATAQINILAFSPELRGFLEDRNARHFLEATMKIYRMTEEEQRRLLEGTRP